MVKHTQTICRQFADELGVFDHFVGLVLKRLNRHEKKNSNISLDANIISKIGGFKEKKTYSFRQFTARFHDTQ